MVCYVSLVQSCLFLNFAPNTRQQNMERKLAERSGNQCECCGASNGLTVFVVAPGSANDPETCVYVCDTCHTQLTGAEEVDANHWRCLNDAMWSEVNAVKVLAFRMLTKLKGEGWPADLLDMMYLDDETLAWAKSEMETEPAMKHVDSNGVELLAGDTVTLIKDLKVKGANFTAKRGTAVRNITLVHDNVEHIEGKVEGQRIVILTQYVKK
jgi:protein PhnA